MCKALRGHPGPPQAPKGSFIDYLHWNDLIAAHFFREENAGQRVFLYVTDDLLSQLGAPFGEGSREFVADMKLGPVWVTRPGLCQRALQALTGWRNRGLKYPPYIGYLGLFVLAAGIEGDYPRHAYYPRLRELIGEDPDSGRLPSFDRMWELWADLETWTNEDKAGSLGVFVFEIAGSWDHVGLPLAQTVLTEQELHALPAIFAKAQLDPTAPVGDEALAMSLARHGAHLLRPRTIRLLENRKHSETDLRQAMLDSVVEELSDWDGSVAMPSSDDAERLFGSLRLCCHLVRVAETAELTLRCRANQPFPEGRMQLRAPGDGPAMHCLDYALGWSERVQCAESERPLDAASLNWLKEQRLEGPGQRWVFRLRASSARIFIDGRVEGLPDFVEVHQLPRGLPFLLAVHESSADVVEQWGESECTGFRRISIVHGLPHKWRLYECMEALGDSTVRARIPSLQLPTSCRLGLEGGLRSSRGNQFFQFALPRVRVSGWHPELDVLCNGVQLVPFGFPELFELPVGPVPGPRLVLELKRSGELLRQRNIYVEKDFPISADRGGRTFDQFGLPTSDRVPTPVIGEANGNFRFNLFSDVRDAPLVVFIGRRPGEVVEWPEEPLPSDWTPVWAVAVRRRRGKARFCGTSLADSEPLPTTNCRSKGLRRWQNWLWHSRKRIDPPTHRSLAKLWTKYVDEARHAR